MNARATDPAACGKIVILIFLVFCMTGCFPPSFLNFEGEFTITTSTSPPATITLSLVHVSAGHVRLAVTSNFTAYNATVYRNGFVCGNVDLSANGPTEFVDTNFSGGGQYSYRVEGLFLYSGWVKSNLLTVAVPGTSGNDNVADNVAAPAYLQATPLDNSVQLAWEAVSGASSYNVYLGTSPGVTRENGTMHPDRTSPATIPGLANGTPYYFVVTSVNGSGTTESAPSPEVSAMPRPPDVVLSLPSEGILDNLNAPVGLPFDGDSAWLYEIYGGHLRRIDLSTGAQSLLATVAPGGNGGAIAADGAHIYFATWSTIFRVGKDGSNLTEFSRTTDTRFIVPLATGIFVKHGQAGISMITLDGAGMTDFYVRPPLSSGFGGGMVADSTKLYWTDTYQGTVNWKALAGGPVVTTVSGANHPDDLLLDADTLYFSTDDGIKAIPSAGGAVTSITSRRGYMEKAGSSLYVANDSTLSRVNLADGSVTVLVTGIQSWCKPAVADNHVYWLDSGSQYGSHYGSLSRIAR